MSLSEHQNPTPERMASAPYNFVPLPEIVIKAVDDAQKLPNHDTYASTNYPHTGYFEVMLTTRSPLYVRCPFTLNDFLRQERNEDQGTPFRNQVKNTPEFFYTRDPNQTVIPGSSLRGMLRNLLEIVSYGKVQWVTEKRLFFRTVDNTAVGKYYNGRLVSGSGTKKDGYWSKTEGGFWRIQSDGSCKIEKCTVARVEMQDVANAFGLDSVNALYDGSGPNATPKWTYQHHTVWVQLEPSETDHPHSRGRFLRYRKVTDIKAARTANYTEATLVLTGPMQHKHLAFAFVKQSSPVYVGVPDDENARLVDRFHDEDQITRWQSHAFPDGQPTGAHRARDGHLRNGEPIFFLRENGQLTFFGRAQMFRLPYTKTPRDLVPPELRIAADIDYADALFGYTKPKKKHPGDTDGVDAQQGDKARAYASRVSVTDATLHSGQNDIWLSPQPIVPKILATPKPTAFQHYLTQQEPNDKNKLDHYDSPPFHETTLRGHKLYWHQGEGTENDLRPAPNSPNVDAQGNVFPTSTQHTQFKPLKPGVTFTFRVYFENLSDAELGALCWTLHPLGDPTKTYCHNLGMGKPLGMGAVQLNATLHLTNRMARYGSLFDSDNWRTGEMGTGENLSDRTILERRTQAFEQHLLRELKPNKKTCTHLLELKRVAMLLRMLEWPGLPQSETATLGLGEFRERKVLPDPSASVFGLFTEDAVPTLTTSKSSTSISQEAAVPSQKAVATTEASQLEDAARVATRIKGLRGRGEVSRMPAIVSQIARIANDKARRDCAELLKQWLRDQKVWNQELHASAPWRKQLNLLLGKENS